MTNYNLQEKHKLFVNETDWLQLQNKNTKKEQLAISSLVKDSRGVQTRQGRRSSDSDQTTDSDKTSYSSDSSSS